MRMRDAGWTVLVPTATVAVAGVSLVSFKKAQWSFALVHLHPPETLAAIVLISVAAIPILVGSLVLAASSPEMHHGRGRPGWLHHVFHLSVVSWGVVSVSVSGVCIALTPAHWKGIAVCGGVILALTIIALGIILWFIGPAIQQGLDELSEQQEQQAFELLKRDPM